MNELLTSIAQTKDVLTLALLMLVLFITTTFFLFRYFTKEALRKELEYMTTIRELQATQVKSYEAFTARLLQTQQIFLNELREIESTNRLHFTELKQMVEDLAMKVPKRATDQH